MSFEVIPAIDIRGGKCVRLYQGNFDQETIFSDDPVAVAMRWQENGARRLHVVDLDGAEAGRPVNTAQIQAIVQSVSVPVQVGGGLRSMGTVDELLRGGVDRVVLGTAAVDNPRLIKDALARHPDRIIVGIDARDGKAATHGWTTTRVINALELAANVIEQGVSRIIYTDISRDGAMVGPNINAIQTFADSTQAFIVASGGVSSIDHLVQLAELPLEGAIIGRAIYTGDVDLREAIEAVEHSSRLQRG